MRAIRMTVAAVAVAALAVPATAQFSDSYNFLKAVRESDGAKVIELLRKSATIIDTRDYQSGEAAMHIVVKRRDMTWLAFLLDKGARTDVRDAQGDTPLSVAARIGFVSGLQLLIGQNAAVDVENGRGETPLIYAVHNHDLATVRMLIAAGANPNRADHIAGKSARDYAADDPRAAQILKVIEDAKPAKINPKMSGPTL